jgi:DNA-binding SARP family transcriptional activator/tetratricopeptide (TPR) repeat protein
VEFGLLGEVRAQKDGVRVELGHIRQRCVLAVLLVEVNRPVPVDRLIDRVWGDEAPTVARTTLYGYIHHLRRAGVEISRRSGGYVLTAPLTAVDLTLFDSLVREARTTPGSALRLLDSALELWRGEPLEGMDSPWATLWREKLTRRRFAVELERNDLALGEGRHHEMLAGLSASVSAHPFDERVIGQFMLAAYRCGLQAEALLCFEEFRGRLADELGADPGPELRGLHRRILNADPDLSTRPAEVRFEPRQLPAPPPFFTGRAKELAQLDHGLLADHGEVVAISVIGGAGGVGKTWLALHWAHRNADNYPDGHLYVNLRGFDPGGAPLDPATALRGFLDALGVPPTASSGRLEDQVGIYRSVIAEKRMLVLLDNAVDTEQVLPLIPGSPSCAVLITSRHRLVGLTTAHGATHIAVDTFEGSEARELFVRHTGPAPVAAEPTATTELLSYCAGLPLAIGIVAARAAASRELPLSALVDELRDRTARLDVLDGGDQLTDLRAVLALSYTALTAGAVDAVGLLAAAPGLDIGLAAAAALIGVPTSRARVVLRELEYAHLVQQYVHGRYRMHDLVRLSAAEHHRERSPQAGRSTALERLVIFYLHTAHAAERKIFPARPDIELVPLTEGVAPSEIANETEAWKWFAAEEANLLAAHPVAVRDWPEMGWQMAWSTDSFHARGGYIKEAVTTWEAGLVAAEKTGRTDVLLIAHRLLGRAYGIAGDHPSALRHLSTALDLAERDGDSLTQGRIHLMLAMSWRIPDDHERALHHADRALRLYGGLGLEMWLSEPLLWMARCLTSLHDYDRAQAHALAGLALARRQCQSVNEAHALEVLGRIAHRTGRFDDAVEYYRLALIECERSNSSYDAPGVLEHLAEVFLAAGDGKRARAAWRQAVDHYQAQRRVADAGRLLEDERFAVAWP